MMETGLSNYAVERPGVAMIAPAAQRCVRRQTIWS
jgi:hypothetical protein